MHEKRNLTESIWYPGYVKQLNLEPRCCVFDVRRLLKPTPMRTFLLSGTSSMEDVISPSLRSHVHHHAKKEISRPSRSTEQSGVARDEAMMATVQKVEDQVAGVQDSEAVESYFRVENEQDTG